MTFIVLLILAAVLFILYKVVTSDKIPNLNVNINNRRNSPSIKGSFNNTTNIDQSTHTNINFESKSSNNPNTLEDLITYILGFIFCAVIVTNVYKKYINQINSILIYSVLIIAFIYILTVLFAKFRGTLTSNLIVYLVVSFCALLVVVYFFFYPKYPPNNISSVLSTTTPVNMSTVDTSIATFIIYQLVGCLGQILFMLISLIAVIRNYSYNQIKNSCIATVIFAVAFSLATSGAFLHLISLVGTSNY
ncbi:hypothetical protein [Clostridium sp. HBUAS56017]|uniref:hypothetical protein n=1 Tax=Clostridium sp. HBUAS56017 TaxID=2571128 RepID=UPI001177909A|nr:hypothetical protein [Clostridium sp. HBUAS56017]